VAKMIISDNRKGEERLAGGLAWCCAVPPDTPGRARQTTRYSLRVIHGEGLVDDGRENLRYVPANCCMIAARPYSITCGSQPHRPHPVACPSHYCCSQE